VPNTNIPRSTDITKYFSYIRGQILVSYQLNKYISYQISFVKRSLHMTPRQDNQNSQHNHYSLSSLDTQSISLRFILMLSVHLFLGLSSRCFPKNVPTKIPNIFLGKKIYCSAILLKHLILIPLKQFESNLCSGRQEAHYLLHPMSTSTLWFTVSEKKTHQFISTQYLDKGHAQCPSCSH
jgi:hypothetical protein